MPTEPVGTEDFDAFVAEQAPARRGATIRLYGKDYQLPASVPLLFTLQIERLNARGDVDALQAVLSTVYGPEALDVWAEAGMTEEQFGVVLMWTTANMRQPGSMTLAEASAQYREEAGKAGAATTSGPTSGAASSASGRSSKRTSPASTSSGRKKSTR